MGYFRSWTGLALGELVAAASLRLVDRAVPVWVDRQHLRVQQLVALIPAKLPTHGAQQSAAMVMT